MAKGLVSYRISDDGRRMFETSELIRVYGELHISDTHKRHREGQIKKGEVTTVNPQLATIQEQLKSLQLTVTLMLEDKTTREAELRQRDEERSQLQEEIRRLTEALEQEKKRGFWSRFFRTNSE